MRALELLGSGLRPETVANAVGVTAGRISQLLADPTFAEEVTKLRVGALQKHNVRDNAYDAIEDDLLGQFRTAMPMLMKPMEILKGMQVINAMKRRGVSAPEAIQQSSVVVTIVMPTKIVQTFTTNIHNQVINAGDQELITIQSGQMGKMLGAKAAAGRATQAVIQERVGALLDSKTQVAHPNGVQHDTARTQADESIAGY
jgi:hypothetical protein